MPSELRKVTFSVDEVQAAIVSHRLHSGGLMPSSPIDHVLLGEGPTAVTIFFQLDDANEIRQWPLTNEEVAAALIRYCAQFAIPLPRMARKRLQVENDGLALICRPDLDS